MKESRAIKQKFYHSTEWRKCSKAYAESKGYLCERCLAKGIYQTGDMVHHKEYITLDNLSNPSISLNWDNLELLCIQCHNEEHTGHITRYKIGELGQVIITGR